MRNIRNWLLLVAVIAMGGTFWLVDVEKVIDVIQPTSVELPRKERITELPQDAEAFYLSLWVRDNDPASAELTGWFNGEPELAGLKTQTHANTYKPSDPYYVARYKDVLTSDDEIPAVTLQDPDGVVIYKATVSSMPDTAEEMVDELAEVLAQCRPKPTPSPKPKPSPNKVPVIRPKKPEQEKEEGSGVGLVIMAALLAAGAGVAGEWKRSN
jgi:hypothetical protein